MPVLPLDCHLPTQYTTHTITLQQWTNNKTNKSYKQLIYIYIYIHISCKCDTNRAGHFTLDAHASIPVACGIKLQYIWKITKALLRLVLVMHMPIHVFHYSDVIMGAIASQYTSFTIIYSTVYSDSDQRKHQSSASLAFVWGNPRWPHKWPVTRKIFPFDDAIMFGIISSSRKYRVIVPGLGIEASMWVIQYLLHIE